MALNLFSTFVLPAGFDDLFDPNPFSANDLMPVLGKRRQNGGGDNENSMLTRSSPGYEIHEDDKQYTIAIDVPGVKMEDMTIKLEENGRVLHLSGGRKIKRGDKVSETKFVKRFTIGHNVDTENIRANLSDGVLEVTAPKKEAKSQVIKIMEGRADEK